MIKRLLIVIVGVLALIFVPYYLGMFIGITGNTDGIVIVWLLGFLGALLVFFFLASIYGILTDVIDYIKNG